jgi:hypothetical protein
MKQEKQKLSAPPKVLYREWKFQSSNPGLQQVLLPSLKDNMGNLVEEQYEAKFGGDSGRDGIWRISDQFEIGRRNSAEPITGRELVSIMRNKIKMKPIADANIVELTDNKVDGDPVYEPVEEEEDAVSQPSR